MDIHQHHIYTAPDLILQNRKSRYGKRKEFATQVVSGDARTRAQAADPRPEPFPLPSYGRLRGPDKDICSSVGDV